MCVLLAQGEALVSRPGEERGVVGVEPLEKFSNKSDYYSRVLE